MEKVWKGDTGDESRGVAILTLVSYVAQAPGVGSGEAWLYSGALYANEFDVIYIFGVKNGHKVNIDAIGHRVDIHNVTDRWIYDKPIYTNKREIDDANEDIGYAMPRF